MKKRPFHSREPGSPRYWCGRCEVFKSADDFYITKNKGSPRVQSYCCACANRMRSAARRAKALSSWGPGVEERSDHPLERPGETVSSVK